MPIPVHSLHALRAPLEPRNARALAHGLGGADRPRLCKDPGKVRTCRNANRNGAL